MGIGIANYNVKENNPDLFTVSEFKKLTSIFKYRSQYSLKAK